jgi:hypothetical protein
MNRVSANFYQIEQAPSQNCLLLSRFILSNVMPAGKMRETKMFGRMAQNEV